MSYALFMHEDYPLFDFTPSSEDDGQEPHTSLRLAYPERLERWKPLSKWFLAIPQYFVLVGLIIAAALGSSSDSSSCSSPGNARRRSATFSSASFATRFELRPASVCSRMANPPVQLRRVKAVGDIEESRMASTRELP